MLAVIRASTACASFVAIAAVVALLAACDSGPAEQANPSAQKAANYAHTQFGRMTAEAIFASSFRVPCRCCGQATDGNRILAEAGEAHGRAVAEHFHDVARQGSRDRGA